MKMQNGRDGIAIYHVVLAHEDFDRTAFNLMQPVQEAQHEYPVQKRTLYLDIEGHRNGDGGFDQDRLELQSKFSTEFLLQFLSRVVTPLATIENPGPQSDDIPNKLNLVSIDGKPGEETPDETPDGSKGNPRFRSRNRSRNKALLP
jgi:hypothetical protein